MHIKNYAFKNLPFSPLFQTYLSNFEELSSFYHTNPFDADAVRSKAENKFFQGHRKESAELLLEFNQQFDVDEQAIKNIHRLEKDDALAIVTGQQLGLYGGPVFTMYKTISAIYLARKLEKELNRPVIPIFWLADEDHDYDEIRSISILSGEGTTSFSLSKKSGGLPPVSELHFPSEIDHIKEQMQSTLIDTDFSDDLWALLDACFTPGNLFIEGFGAFISRLFSKHGLVMAGSNHAGIKGQTKEVLKTAVNDADSLRKALEDQSEELDENFHQQVTLYDSHLFYLDDEAGRIKIHRKDDKWETDSHQWSKKELLDEIEHHPERFSPDVFLRPVLQDKLLPTLGYVAGPGELAYYGQMKTFYACFDQQMPVIFPRLSGTFIEPAIDRILQELPFEIKEYNNRIEDLESEFIDRSGQTDIEALFGAWKKQMDEVSSPHKETIKHVDETLEGAAEKAQAIFSNELDKLKGKVYRAAKKNEQTQIDRIHRIQHHLFPDRNLQERRLCGIYYMNKFGLDIWDRLLAELESDESLDDHKLIYL